MESLRQSSCPVVPFSTANDAADDGAKATGEDDDAAQTKSPKKKKKASHTTAAKTKGKKPAKKTEIAGDEEEQGLAVVQPSQPVAASGPAADQPAAAEEAGTYVPGKFNQVRLDYIRKHRAATGVSFKEASNVWMSSSERASLLANVPLSQMKKRRFF